MLHIADSKKTAAELYYSKMIILGFSYAIVSKKSKRWVASILSVPSC